MIPNFDEEKGIHYGVIHQNECLQAWAEDSEPYYSPIECECGELVEIGDDECPNCETDLELEFDFLEPSSFYIDNGEYTAESDSFGDIFVIKSPYYTLAEFCSPCAPNAGYIANEGSVKSYCFGHDFFDSGKAPYKVYSVETDKEVLPQ